MLSISVSGISVALPEGATGELHGVVLADAQGTVIEQPHGDRDAVPDKAAGRLIRRAGRAGDEGPVTLASTAECDASNAGTEPGRLVAPPKRSAAGIGALSRWAGTRHG
ncbi:MAG: hypothetical protein U0075_14375 [Thermomicrobiales bacterium]